MTITIEAVKKYNTDLALLNRILDKLKFEYVNLKLIHADKSPLELIVKAHNNREFFYKDTPEIYDQALQALIDLVNSKAI
jgi:diketogulonate reductase-like aldo/keto reductase